MEKKIKKLISIMLMFVFILTAAITTVGCGEKTENVSKEGKEKEPVVIRLSGGDSGYLSPYTHYPRGPGSFKMKLIFDSLIERGEEGYIPWLAQKWDISDDGKEYTFHLAKNVKWHDGKPMTAEDVKFSFEYFAKHPPISNDLFIKGKSIVEKAEVIDENTIKITVVEPNATNFSKLGSARIIPKHIWENVDDPDKFDAPEAVIGCGPYKLVDYNKEQGAYKFEAFKDYWGPKHKVDVIEFIPVSDNVLAFDKGDIDLTGVTPDIVSKYQNKDEYTVTQSPAFWGYVLKFNMEKRPELKDKNVRQAMAYAMNQEELVEKVARGAAVPASAGYLPVDHVWYNKDVKKYDYNIEKAKELLGGKNYSFTLLIAGETKIAELLKLDFAKAGIELNVKSVDGKSRDAAIKSGDYEIAINGYGGWGSDADMLRTTYVPGQGKKSGKGGPGKGSGSGKGSGGKGGPPSVDSIPGYKNDKIKELAEKQLKELDENKRKEMVFKLQEEIAEEVPQIPIYNTKSYTVYNNEKYDGWKYMFDHHSLTHSKISFLDVK